MVFQCFLFFSAKFRYSLEAWEDIQIYYFNCQVIFNYIIEKSICYKNIAIVFPKNADTIKIVVDSLGPE